jgi:hypothetical protein
MFAIDDTANPSTDALPVVELAPAPPRTEVPRALMGAIWATGIGVAVCALALLVAGVGHAIGSRAAAARAPSAPSLVMMTAQGPGQATYRVAGRRFGMTIRTNRPTWIQVGSPGGRPAFSGVLPAGASQHFDETGPTAVGIGAGGSAIDIQSGALHQTVTPPVAPFTAVFEPR